MNSLSLTVAMMLYLIWPCHLWQEQPVAVGGETAEWRGNRTS